MTYRGEVKGGMVVLEGVRLPDGTIVRVEPVPRSRPRRRKHKNPLSAMGDLAVETGMKDLATNADHYLYGHPKVSHGAQELRHFARAYGPDEPEYTLADLKPEENTP